MTSTQTNYTISQLAAEFGITTRTIRFYEEKGLLQPLRNGTNRSYSAADHIRLKLILRGKRLGFSLQESQDIIDLYNPTHGNAKQLTTLLDKIHQKQVELEHKKKEIQTMLKDLKNAEKNCLRALS